MHDFRTIPCRPAVSDKTFRQMIQQFRMTGPVTHFSKIIRTPNDTSSEKVMPNSIHINPCCQWVLGRCHPVCELQSSACARGNIGCGRTNDWSRDGKKAPLHHLTQISYYSSQMNMPISASSRSLTDITFDLGR